MIEEQFMWSQRMGWFYCQAYFQTLRYESSDERSSPRHTGDGFFKLENEINLSQKDPIRQWCVFRYADKWWCGIYVDVLTIVISWMRWHEVGKTICLKLDRGRDRLWEQWECLQHARKISAINCTDKCPLPCVEVTMNENEIANNNCKNIVTPH